MLLRLAYLGVTNALARLRLLPMSDPDKDAEVLALQHQITVLERDRDKDVEVLTLRHQITVLQRHLGGQAETAVHLCRFVNSVLAMLPASIR